MSCWPLVQLRHIARLSYGDSLAADARVDGGVEVFGSNGRVGMNDFPNTAGPVIVVGRKGSHGKIQYSKQPVFAIDTTYFIDRTCSSHDLRWLYYALLTIGLDGLSHDVGVPGLSREAAYAQRLPLPGQHQQRAIADFLDSETTRIDSLVARKHRLLSLLRERMARRIDSAVEPANETALPSLSAVIQIAEGQVDPRRSPYADMPLIAPDYVESGTGRLGSPETASQQGAISGKYLCEAGDVIYSKIRPALRKVCIAPERCLTSADMYPIRPISSLRPAYLYYFLLSERFTDFAVAESERVAMPKINRDALGRIRIPLPPLSVQDALVAELDSERRRWEAISGQLAFQLELIAEHRQALITAAVSGELEVPGVAA